MSKIIKNRWATVPVHFRAEELAHIQGMAESFLEDVSLEPANRKHLENIQRRVATALADLAARIVPPGQQGVGQNSLH